MASEAVEETRRVIARVEAQRDMLSAQAALLGIGTTSEPAQELAARDAAARIEQERGREFGRRLGDVYQNPNEAREAFHNHAREHGPEATRDEMARHPERFGELHRDAGLAGVLGRTTEAERQAPGAAVAGAEAYQAREGLDQHRPDADLRAEVAERRAELVGRIGAAQEQGATEINPVKAEREARASYDALSDEQRQEMRGAYPQQWRTGEELAGRKIPERAAAPALERGPSEPGRIQVPAIVSEAAAGLAAGAGLSQPRPGNAVRTGIDSNTIEDQAEHFRELDRERATQGAAETQRADGEAFDRKTAEERAGWQQEQPRDPRALELERGRAGDVQDAATPAGAQRGAGDELDAAASAAQGVQAWQQHNEVRSSLAYEAQYAARGAEAVDRAVRTGQDPREAMIEHLAERAGPGLAAQRERGDELREQVARGEYQLPSAEQWTESARNFSRDATERLRTEFPQQAEQLREQHGTQEQAREELARRTGALSPEQQAQFRQGAPELHRLAVENTNQVRELAQERVTATAGIER